MSEEKCIDGLNQSLIEWTEQVKSEDSEGNVHITGAEQDRLVDVYADCGVPYDPLPRDVYNNEIKPLLENDSKYFNFDRKRAFYLDDYEIFYISAEEARKKSPNLDLGEGSAERIKGMEIESEQIIYRSSGGPTDHDIYTLSDSTLQIKVEHYYASAEEQHHGSGSGRHVVINVYENGLYRRIDNLDYQRVIRERINSCAKEQGLRSIEDTTPFGYSFDYLEEQIIQESADTWEKIEEYWKNPDTSPLFVANADGELKPDDESTIGIYENVQTKLKKLEWMKSPDEYEDLAAEIQTLVEDNPKLQANVTLPLKQEACAKSFENFTSTSYFFSTFEELTKYYELAKIGEIDLQNASGLIYDRALIKMSASLSSAGPAMTTDMKDFQALQQTVPQNNIREIKSYSLLKTKLDSQISYIQNMSKINHDDTSLQEGLRALREFQTWFLAL